MALVRPKMGLELGVIMLVVLCLQRVYIDQTAVDDALVDLIYQPSSAAPISCQPDCSLK